MKLMLLIMPTIHSIVNPRHDQAAGLGEGTMRSAGRRTGCRSRSIVMPAATASAGERELAEQLPARAELPAVVEDSRDAPPARRRRTAPRAAGRGRQGEREVGAGR